MNRIAWTQEELATVQRMAKEGYQLSVIATHMGRTRDSIVGILARLRKAQKGPGRCMPDWSEAELATLKEMSELGIKNEFIAQKIGRSNHSVARKKYDLKKATGVDYMAVERRIRIERQPMHPLVREFKLHAAAKGIPLAKVAIRSGCTDSAVLAWGKSDPRLSHFQAAAQVVGLRLVLVPMEDAA